MTAGSPLERRYRRLLAWYPAGYRTAFGEEMIGVLMAAADGDGGRPGLRGTLDLILGGLRTRFRAARRKLTDIDWPDSLAVCSVAAPVLLLGFLTNWLYLAHGGRAVWVARGLVVLALAGPVVLALRYRRAGALVTLSLAGWLFVFLLSQVAQFWWNWILPGDLISGVLALLLTSAATAFSAGPRRGIAVLTWRSWLVLAGAGISMGVIHQYLWGLPAWVVALVVAAVLALIAAGILATIPGPVARGTLLLLAVPAYPGAVWAAGSSAVVGFPNFVFLPTIALAVVVAAVALRAGRRAARGRRP